MDYEPLESHVMFWYLNLRDHGTFAKFMSAYKKNFNFFASWESAFKFTTTTSCMSPSTGKIRNEIRNKSRNRLV